MRYFKDKKEAKQVLEYIKKQYKKKHDKFHKFNLELLQADAKKDDFFTFLKKIVVMDLQSRPYRLSKHDVLKIFDKLEEKYNSKIFQEKIRNNLTNENSKDRLDYLYDCFLSIKGIGGKIANLVIRNFIYFGDTEKYFGVKKNKLLPFLRVPIDVHVANLLCYKLEISPIDLYDKIRNASGDEGFQNEAKEICNESSILSPADWDILWYIGYQNCNKRIYCSACRIKDECHDQHFERETRKNMKNKSKEKQERMEKEIMFVKNHSEISFNMDD